MTLNLTKGFNKTVYNTKHTQNTKLHFEEKKTLLQKSHFFKNPSFSKIRHSFESAFFVHLYGPPFRGPKNLVYVYIYISIYIFTCVYLHYIFCGPHKYSARDASATSYPTNATRPNHFIAIFQSFPQKSQKIT